MGVRTMALGMFTALASDLPLHAPIASALGCKPLGGRARGAFERPHAKASFSDRWR
jgi:hypothetical protein